MTSTDHPAPFLMRAVYVEPPPAPEPEVEEPAESPGHGFDPDDFPAWYRDKVVDDPVEESESPPAAAAEPPYYHQLAAVRTLEQMAFGAVTVLAGDNGAGKSTLIEAIAVASGFNPEGGSRNLQFSTYATHSALAEHLTLHWNGRPRWGWFLRAETFYGMASHIALDNDPVSGIAVMFPDLHNRSHGESFLALAQSRFTGRGLYILDEPESALSIQGQMALVAIIADSLAKGSQFIISTHSPVFMTLPEAHLYEIDHDEGVRKVAFEDLVSTVLWRRLFADPLNFHGRLL